MKKIYMYIDKLAICLSISVCASSCFQRREPVSERPRQPRSNHTETIGNTRLATQEGNQRLDGTLFGEHYRYKGDATSSGGSNAQTLGGRTVLDKIIDEANAAMALYNNILSGIKKWPAGLSSLGESLNRGFDEIRDILKKESPEDAAGLITKKLKEIRKNAIEQLFTALGMLLPGMQETSTDTDFNGLKAIYLSYIDALERLVDSEEDKNALMDKRNALRELEQNRKSSSTPGAGAKSGNNGDKFSGSGSKPKPEAKGAGFSGGTGYSKNTNQGSNSGEAKKPDVSSMPREKALGILGLSPGVSASDIRKRYKELVIIHHPDKGGNRAKFIKIQDAYESLTKS